MEKAHRKLCSRKFLAGRQVGSEYTRGIHVENALTDHVPLHVSLNADHIRAWWYYGTEVLRAASVPDA